MSEKNICVYLAFASAFVSLASGTTYTVLLPEYEAVGGTTNEGDLEGCAGSYLLERVDSVSVLVGQLQDGAIVSNGASNCGDCPAAPISTTVSASEELQNTLTKTISSNISAGISVVSASLDAGISWTDGQAVNISGSATVGPVQPCYFQEGEFVFEYYGNKGKKVNHNYTAYWVTNGKDGWEGANCPHSSGTKIVDGTGYDESTNVGSHYHQASATWSSTQGGYCDGCTPASPPES